MTATVTDQADAMAAPAPASGLTRKTMAFAALALCVGAAVGTVVVAPRLRGGPATAKAAAPEAKKKEGPPVMIKLENLIVNPAGTQGGHFLIVSIGIEVPNAVVETRLRESEVPLRDAVNDVLGRMTMDQLNQPDARDMIRRQLKVSAIKFAQDSSLQIFLPQFLIQ